MTSWRLLLSALGGVVVSAHLIACGQGGSSGGTCPDGCLSPPPPTCTGDVLTTFGFLGECVDGVCEYPVAATETCANGCAEGACVVVEDPCDGVSCNTPPGPTCEDDVRVVYGSAGECNADDGTCSYPPVRTNCADRGQVCRGGNCVTPGLCDEVTCDTPPVPACDGRTAITYAAAGTCDDATGECDYEATRTSCAASGQTCSEGTCVDRPPCEGLNCDTTPAPRCEGSVAVTTDNGRCDATTDTCAWDEARTDCFELDLACVEGACVASTACEGVVCGEPPGPTCDGDVVLESGAGGRCDPTSGACRWPVVPRDCSELELTCVDGACADGLCAGVTCSVPPVPRCEGDVAVGSVVPGICARGRCSYDPVRTNCADTDQVCSAGQCVERPVCDTLVCDTPPADVCDGDVAVTYAALGTCDDGACSYEATRTDCAAAGQGCRDGACFDRCEGVECLETPPPYCVGDVLRAPVGVGLCDGGLCSFSEVLVNCAATGQRCLDGGCRTACYGVACDEPPAPTCEGDSLLTYVTAGVCNDATGGCRYAPTVVNCALTGEVCLEGACVPDPCLTAVCDTPGAPYCAGDTLRSPQGPGVCFDRACQYFERTTDCTTLPGGRCLDGDCRDRCYGVACELPPVATCEGDTAVQYGETGTCDPASGGCSYEPRYVNCVLTDEVCRAGRCVPPPCRGVSCDTAPAPTCDGEVLTTYLAPGACDEGLCEYPTLERDCAASGLQCADGACRDQCYGVSCEEPPAPRCSGDVLVNYAPAGTCDPADGLCDYATAPRNCVAEGLVCRAGACVEPPCSGVVCNSPPAPTCEGNQLVSAYGDGTCDVLDGSCDYATLREDCTLDGGRCGDGRCISPCEDLACAEQLPPPPVCSGDIAVSFAVTGQCNPDLLECVLDTTRRNCVTEGLVCRDGACVEPPCTGVTCDTPPAPYCLGDALRTPFGLGQCDNTDGLCDFAERVEDCSLDGGRCADGRCVGPCEGVACDTPPRGFCGGSIAFAFPNDGTCNEPAGNCTYAAVATNCFLDGLVCRDGACVEPPCSGVTCDEPPAPTCEGSVAIAAYGTGTCDSETGDCDYLTRTEDCSLDGGRCEDGQCVAFCDGVVCNDLPDNTCAGDVALRYEAPGVCSDFLLECVYTPALTNCASLGQVCRDGACVDPPCTGVTCNAPAAPFCEGDVLVREFGTGACDPLDGTCGYASTREDCAADGGACRDGACLEACDLLVCDDFPADTCEGDTALVYATAQCSNLVGACQYPPTAINCGPLGLVCRDGACVEPPCSGVTCDVPTAPFCEGEVLVTSSLPGTCAPDTGLCQFLTSREDCAADGGACRDGACLEFCDLITCDDVPADTCEGDIAFDYTAGLCDPILGGCRYDPVVTNCAVRGDICVDGRCLPSPCEGVSCEVPPAPYCEGPVRIEPVGEGECDRYTGVCNFGLLTEDCSLDFGDCRDGACLGFCDLEACDDVPADTCEGDVAFAYSIGLCDPFNYRCDYPADTTNCADEGLVCRNGACAPSLCEGVTCNAPRAPYCDGDTAIAEFGAGTCSEQDGACQYTAISEDCTLDGGICRDGRCLDPCEFLVCDDPPANRCEGDVVFDYTDAGECNPLLGACEYLPAFVNCTDSAQVCRGDRCVDNPCNDVTCNAPPTPFCDGNTLIGAFAGGVCDELDGTCDYPIGAFDCASINATCRNGSCEDNCVGVSCNAPPADFCDGDIARQFPASGTCTLPSGTCQYVPVSTNCALTGEICQAGDCVPNPCSGVDCSAPPAPVCDGNTARIAQPGGECSRLTGRCAWSITSINCAAFGQVCLAGACQSPCALTTCDDPPPPECLGDIAVSYPPVGECDPASGDCSYLPAYQNCPAADASCVAGTCVPNNPCEGVTCDTPPPAWCDDRVAITYDELGTCDAGSCLHDETRTNCALSGRFCRDGECVDADPCIGVTCGAPPISICLGNTVSSYGPGVCSAGNCEFEPRFEDCTLSDRICLAGQCVEPEPCDGPCVSPPAPACVDDRLLEYAPEGTCVDNVCLYTPLVTDCAGAGQLCRSLACVDADPCFGVICDEPQPRTCAGTFLVEYPTVGNCVDGACAWDGVPVYDCARDRQVCVDGECVDGPCTDLLCFPPTPVCVDERVRRVFVSGTCNDGECEYTEALEDCAAFDPLARCFGGVCATEDPCEGIVCNTPPAPRCFDSVAESYALPGTCNPASQRCGYVTTREDCADLDGFCVDGACTSVDPCDGVVCNTPPDDLCTFNLLSDFPNPGTCVAGECVYEPDTIDCTDDGRFCYNGACQDDDPCVGLNCGELIDPVCDGNTAVVYNRGFCNAGLCVRPESRTNCSLTGATCVDGACLGGNPCLGVVCDAPPAPFCRGTDAVVSALPGTCTDGECGYVETVSRCGDDGDTCFNGACVPPAYDLRPGDVVVTEIFLAPTAEAWFEVRSNAAASINLRGMLVRSPTSGTDFTVTTDVVLLPGDHAVLGAPGATTADPDVTWPAAFRLTTPSGSLRLQGGGNALDDQVWSSSWPWTSGTAMQLHPDDTAANLNNDPANWCPATAAYAPARFGTPGGDNLDCP